MKKEFSNRSKKSGFNLMELIIVIVIIGILIGAVIGLGNQREVAKVSAMEQMITQTMTATNGWAALMGQEDYRGLDKGDVKLGMGYDVLVTNGSLPANFDRGKAHPWNGTAFVYSLDWAMNNNGGGKAGTGDSTDNSLGAVAGNLQNHFVIEVNNLPQFACQALNSKFSNKHYQDETNGYPSSLEDINGCNSTTSQNTWRMIQ